MLNLLTKLNRMAPAPDPQPELTQRCLQFQVGGISRLMPLGHLREVSSISAEGILSVPGIPPQGYRFQAVQDPLQVILSRLKPKQNLVFLDRVMQRLRI
ncbi:MAG: hypothetical protein HC818_03025 [Synechococcaceae cyanobacterium RM1_1_27]|nr:hypothetical protein [Synechococcaceae cyanobacterium SM2_3_2]NJO85733.1 hypothetical protein [Synechococcaceae cyanobacterium RM1_1_27]